MISTKYQLSKLNKLIVVIFSIIANLCAADKICDDLLESRSAALIPTTVDADAIIPLNCSQKHISMGAISGPQILGDKESTTKLLNFLKVLLNNQNTSAQICLKQESGSLVTNTLSHHYGPYVVRSKGWYSKTADLDKEEFLKNLDKVLKNPEEECRMIVYSDGLVLSLLAGTKMNPYSGAEENDYHFYDLKLS